MLLLVLTTVLAQSPSPVVLSSRRTGIAPEPALKMEQTLAARLAVLGVTAAEPPEDSARKLSAKGISDAADCAGNRECLSRLGGLLDAAAVIGFEVGSVGDELAVHVELLDVRTTKRLAQASFVLSANAPMSEWDKPLKPFATQARAALATLPPPQRVEDVPRVEQLTPKDTPPPVVAVQAQGSRVPSYALGGAAIASVGVAAVFFAIATQQRAALYGEQQPDGRFAPAFSRSESEARAGIYDRNYSIAAGAAVVSLALGVGSYLLMPRSAP